MADEKIKYTKNPIEDLQLMVWVLKRIPTSDRAKMAFRLAMEAMEKPEADRALEEQLRNSPSVT